MPTLLFDGDDESDYSSYQDWFDGLVRDVKLEFYCWKCSDKFPSMQSLSLHYTLKHM